MISALESDSFIAYGGAEDAGLQTSTAVRYSSDGTREIIFLGYSGNEARENKDANAQALYALLRRWFPDVTDYDGYENMSPKGFESVSLCEFIGFLGAIPDDAKIEAYDCDCEAGLIPREISESEEEELIAKFSRLIVTGKHDAVCVTGGTKLFTVKTASGERLFSIETYNGLLVRNDGMYDIAYQE